MASTVAAAVKGADWTVIATGIALAALIVSLHNTTRTDINQIRTDINQIRADVNEIRADVDQVRAELRADMREDRAELSADMNRLRVELLNEIRALNGAAPLAPASAETVPKAGSPDR